MRKFLNEKFLFAALFFALGAGSITAVKWIRDRMTERRQISAVEQIFSDDFNLFPEESSKKYFHHFSPEDPSQNLALVQREDQNYIYYEFKVQGINPETLDVKVENGMVALSGEVQKKEDSENSHMIYQSRFSRMFPAPTNANSDKVEIENSKDKIIIKFPKV